MHSIFQTTPVLLQIIDYLDVPTLLSLRLVNTSINGVISNYESSIAKSIAKTLCTKGEYERLSERHPSTLPDLKYFIQLDLSHRLAIIAIASHQQPRLGDSVFEGIPPDDDLGDEIRHKVQHGFMIIYALSQMYKQVSKLHSEPRHRKFTLKSLAGGPTSTQKASESELLRQWLEYVPQLSKADAVDLFVALWCLRAKVIFDQRASQDQAASWSNVETDEEIEAIQWTVYHIARMGLGFINDLWSTNANVAYRAKNRIMNDLGQKSSKLIALEALTDNEFARCCRQTFLTPSPQCHNVSNQADIYCESTFAYRVGPGHNSLPPEELESYRYDVAIASMMRVGCNLGTGGATKGWRKRKKQ